MLGERSFGADDYITISCPDQVNQGEAFILQISSSGQIQDVQISWLDKVIWPPVIKIKDNWITLALLFAGLEQLPGQYPLTIKIVAAENIKLTKRQVEIMAKSYPVQRLSLPKKMVRLDEATQKRVSRETHEIRRVRENITAHQSWWPDFIRPVEGEVTTAFGVRRILNGEPRAPHRGVDFRARIGTPVRAWSSGAVALVADHYFSGYSVYLDHGLGVITAYLHLSEILLEKDMTVEAGQIIGRTGNTGRSTGPHLHFGLSVLGTWVNPLPLFHLTSELSAHLR